MRKYVAVVCAYEKDDSIVIFASNTKTGVMETIVKVWSNEDKKQVVKHLLKQKDEQVEA